MRGGANIAQAIELFETATLQDPSFARAWSSLAGAHITMPSYSDETEEEHFPQALIDARKALALDPTIAEAHAVLAEIARVDRRWSEAEAHFRNAIENEPKDPTSHLWYAEHLQSTGRSEAALEEGLIAYRLDPLHPGTNDVLGGIYTSLGDDVNREKYLKQAIQHGHNGAMLELADLRLGQGRFEEAMEFTRDFELAAGPDNGILVAQVVAHQDKNSRQAFFDKIENSDTQVSKHYFLSDYVSFDRLDEAFAIASDIDAFRGNDFFVFWRKNMAAFRSDPRFSDVVEAAGLIDYWNEYGWPPACSLTGDSIVCH
jgi:Tfp pilus assembly protein PilF